MTDVNMGKLHVVNHEASSIAEALGVPEDRFDIIFENVKEIWDSTNTVSETIEAVCNKFKDSECALGLVVVGILLESARAKREHEKESEE